MELMLSRGLTASKSSLLIWVVNFTKAFSSRTMVKERAITNWCRGQPSERFSKGEATESVVGVAEFVFVRVGFESIKHLPVNFRGLN